MSSMLNSTKVTSQIDDDFLRRLISAIEEACGVPYQSLPAWEYVKNYIDGDLFIAYDETKRMFQEAYPELYPATEDDE